MATGVPIPIINPVDDICWCCLGDKYVNNLLNECSDGETESYAEMLKNTFCVEIAHHREEQKICGDCVLLLKTAYDFKKRVIESHEKLERELEQMSRFKFQENTGSDETVKLELIKKEEDNDADEIDFHFEEVDTGGNLETSEDDECLANIKVELVKSETHKVQGRRRSLTTSRKTKRCRSKEDKHSSEITDHTKPSIHEKDWIKIAERRGNGPLLRENSLKLLANSTMCVFQWDKSRYRCFCCKEPFSDLNCLREHTSSKHTLKNIEKKIILQQNRLVKVEVSSLYCKICKEEMSDLTTLRSHLESTHKIDFGLKNEDLLVPFKLGSSVLQCQICSETFTVFRLLNIHMNKHFQKQVCHVCGAGFSNLVFLNLHKTRSHRPLRCNTCNLEFARRSEKKEHDVNVHNIKIERKLRFPCPFCNERFFQENIRVQHLVEKHGMDKPEHRCTVCGKAFITKSLCNNHVKNVHMKERNRECDVCHMRFYTKSDVVRHRVTHTGEKNFSCNLCNNLFATKDSLRRHLKRTHVNSN